MWLSIISALIGLLSSSIPNLIRYFERKQEITYELELTRLKVEAATRGYQVSQEINGVNAGVADATSARQHDAMLDGGTFINQLRASVRPIITYTLFGIWLFIKLRLIAVLLTADNIDVMTFSNVILDQNTMALFSLVMGFWFGARSFERLGKAPTTTNSINKRN